MLWERKNVCVGVMVQGLGEFLEGENRQESHGRGIITTGPHGRYAPTKVVTFTGSSCPARSLARKATPVSAVTG
jgi:hypothetical protein